MDIFNVISLLGGLAMFLYGMRLMGDSLKENSSGTLKAVMEKVTDNAFRAFMVGVLATALIQSSTATIVITAGLVSAGILTLHQSLGIIIGANVGTSVCSISTRPAAFSFAFCSPPRLHRSPSLSASC